MSQERSNAEARRLRDAYRQKPFDYAIYTLAGSGQRAVDRVKRPTFVWKGRLESIFKT